MTGTTERANPSGLEGRVEGTDPGHARATLRISALAVLLVFLDTTVLFVAFPNIVASFPEVGPTGLSWVLNAYTIVYAALLVPAGKLSDRWGHKRTFLAGAMVFTLASTACGVAPGPGWLIAFRAVQAVGGALLIPASLALVIGATPRHHIPVAVAIWGATGAVAGAVGPTLGAGLIEVAGWRGVFLLNLPVGLFAMLAGRSVLRESAKLETRAPAISGVVTIAAGAALTALGFVQSEDWGWSDPRTLGALGLGFALLVGFGLAQRTARAPVIEPSLFAESNFLWANVASIPFGFAFTAMFLGSILFLTQVWGWSTLAAGLGIAPGPALVAVVAPRLGGLAQKIGQRPLILLGGVIYAASGLHRLAFLGVEANYWIDYLPSTLMSGLGVALCIPQISSSIAQALPPAHLGVGSATNQAIRQFAGTFGVALTIALVSGATTPIEAVAGYDRAWWLLVIGGLLTTALAWPLRPRRSPGAPE